MRAGLGVAVKDCRQELVWRWENACRSGCGGGRMRAGVGVVVGECVQEWVAAVGECVQEWV